MTLTNHLKTPTLLLTNVESEEASSKKLFDYITQNIKVDFTIHNKLLGK
jgi:hypothetical protein